MVKYIAQQFVAPSPEAQVVGYGLTSFFQSLYADDISSILGKYGFSEFVSDQWYSIQTILDILKTICESDSNVTEKLVALGISMVGYLPDGYSVLGALEQVYSLMQQTTRNVPENYGTSVVTVGAKHLRVFSNSPFPDESTYGYLWGIVNRYKPAHDVFVVRIIDNPDPENHPGTCFDIKWGATPEDVE
jgi:hypothetical protein